MDINKNWINVELSAFSFSYLKNNYFHFNRSKNNSFYFLEWKNKIFFLIILTHNYLLNTPAYIQEMHNFDWHFH